MRRFPTISLLEARQDYKAMFNSILAGDARPEHRSEEDEKFTYDHTNVQRNKETVIDREIKWARETLEKSDRIVWYLRFFRNAMTAPMSSREKLEANRVISKMTKDRFEHFFSLDYVKIQDYVFGKKSSDQVMRDLESLEREYVAAARSKIKSDDPSLEGTQTILDFGNGWAWVSLNRPYCSEEGRAMGHCGNSPRSGTDDNILSLRKLTNKGDGSSHWEPHLTFTINEGGELMEMKGRGNAKPVERYHEMIASLLLMPGEFANGYYISDIIGGSWLPENDFAVSDMTEKLQERVLRERPSLGNVKQYLDFGGDPSSPMFLTSLRRYSRETNFPVRGTNWYHWDFRDGELCYVATFGNSVVKSAFLQDWEGSRYGFAMDFHSLFDTAAQPTDPFSDPVEDALKLRNFEDRSDEVEEFQKRGREEAREAILAAVNKIAQPLEGVVWIDWESARKRDPRISHILLRITDPHTFVNMLGTEQALVFKRLVESLQGSSPSFMSQNDLLKLDAKLDREMHNILTRP